MGASQPRTVRLILLDYVPGISLQQTDPLRFTQYQRLQIMKCVIDFESSAYKLGVLLTDLCPRNVIHLQGPDTTILGTVFLDFTGASCRHDDPAVRAPDLFLGQYISPILQWDKLKAIEFIEWINCDFQGWINSTYAHTAASITPDMRNMYS